MTTTTADLQEIEDFSSEDFPEFRIETAAEKMKVNLTDDIVVSLTSRVGFLFNLTALYFIFYY